MIPIKIGRPKVTEIQDLETMAAKLLEIARNLPPGSERHSILKEIGTFRVQIISMQGVGSRRARREWNRAKAE
jgi:hypothetical protein